MHPALRRRLLAGAAVALLGLAGVLATGVAGPRGQPDRDRREDVRVGQRLRGPRHRHQRRHHARSPAGRSRSTCRPAPPSAATGTRVMTRSGNRYSFTNPSWGGTIAPGGTASFGFIGAGLRQPVELHAQRRAVHRRREPGRARHAGHAVRSPAPPTRRSRCRGAAAAAPSPATGCTRARPCARPSPAPRRRSAGSAPASRTRTRSRAYNGNGESGRSAAVTGTTTGCPTRRRPRRAVPVPGLGQPAEPGARS